MEKNEARPCSNQRTCPCQAIGCKNHGRCCDCIAHHRSLGGLPNCYPKREKK